MSEPEGTRSESQPQVFKDRRRPLSERRPPKPKVSVIVPTLNEAANVREILPYLADYYEVIVVDGRSTDGTADVAREVLPTAKVISQTRKGKGNAMACGFAAATG
ncbi:MAG: glycosyltransferase, partial [Actinomycetes bacterium]